MKATKIKMKPGSRYSDQLAEIDEIYLTDCNPEGYYKKAYIHDCVKKYPGSIQVAISPFPSLIPETSINGEKYVRSAPDATAKDNLLRLPRE